MDEFELIQRFLDRKRDHDAPGVVIGIGDDGAVLNPNPERQQVQVTDTLVEGVHFPADTSPADIAFRAVAVNLSDIAAMGAEPRWMTVALTLNSADPGWIESFANGLFSAADTHAVTLVGGDTTKGPIVTVTVTITGDVETGAALLRSGARVGDGIYVTGTLGDAAAGLAMLRSGQPADEYLAGRFLRPRPRIEMGRALISKASAAIDISDGLAGDLNKLLVASGVGGEIEMRNVPISDALARNFAADALFAFALTGGDDYELCFTAAAGEVDSISGITPIGTVTSSAGLVCRHNGVVVEVDDSGYRHFE